jgi:hypothetical protein
MHGITKQQKKDPCGKKNHYFVTRVPAKNLLLVPNQRQREEKEGNVYEKRQQPHSDDVHCFIKTKRDALFEDVKDLAKSFLLVPKKRQGEKKSDIEKEDPPHSDDGDQRLIKKKRDALFEEVKDPVRSFLLVPKKRQGEEKDNIEKEEPPPSDNDQHLIKKKKDALLKDIKDLQEEKDNLLKSLHNEKNREEIVKLKDEVEYLKDKIHDLNFNIDLKDRDLLFKKTEITKKDVEIDKLKTTIHDLERCDLESVRRIEELESARHIEELESVRRIEELEMFILDWEMQAVELEVQVTELQTWGADLETKIFEWESYSSNLQQKLVEATKRNASVEGGVSQVILTLLSTMHVNGMDVGLGGVVREADRLIQTVIAKNGFKRGFHLDVEHGIVDVEVDRAKRRRIVEEGLDEDRFYENHASDNSDDLLGGQECDLCGLEEIIDEFIEPGLEKMLGYIDEM